MNTDQVRDMLQHEVGSEWGESSRSKRTGTRRRDLSSAFGKEPVWPVSSVLQVFFESLVT